MRYHYLSTMRFREMHLEYQYRHAEAGRARRCVCCTDHFRAEFFEGASVICRLCEADMNAAMEGEAAFYAAQDKQAEEDEAFARLGRFLANEGTRDDMVAIGLVCDDGRGPPPSGDDWCPRGCQPLYGLGECGMCGTESDGVWESETDEVIDADEETGRYIRRARREDD